MGDELTGPQRLCISLAELRSSLSERIMYMDGAMGTMIQQLELGEEGYQGEVTLRSHCITRGQY